MASTARTACDAQGAADALDAIITVHQQLQSSRIGSEPFVRELLRSAICTELLR